MKRLIFTLITLFTISFANAQIISLGKMVANENGLLFKTGEIQILMYDTLKNIDYYNVDDYKFYYQIAGPVIVYDIYGHIKKHIYDNVIDLWALIYETELAYGTYIIAPYGYKAFLIFDGNFSVNKTGKFIPFKLPQL